MIFPAGLFSRLIYGLFRYRPPARPPMPPAPVPVSAPAGLADLFAILNRERRTAGLPALSISRPLNAAAMAHAAVMAADGLDFHLGLEDGTPESRIEAQGYRWSACGECIGPGYPTASALVAGWMADPPHRAIVLGAYADVGVGVVRDAHGYTWWCADFASPMPPPPSPPQSDPGNPWAVHLDHITDGTAS